MKKILILLIAITMLSACQNNIGSYSDDDAAEFETKMKNDQIEIRNFKTSNEKKSSLVIYIEDSSG